MQGAATCFGQLARLFADKTSELLRILYTKNKNTLCGRHVRPSVRNEIFAATPFVTCTNLGS
jgi:hypothetical protein